jgi:hypothetical protein
MPLPAELLARPGEEIRPAYDRLLRWIEAQRLVSTDDRVKITPTPNGQLVHATERPPSIVTPLQVNQAGANFYSVREGYVNGRLPLIQTQQGEKPLVDEDGVPHPAARLPPDRPILVVAEVTFTSALALEKVLITTKRPRELLRTGTADYASATQGKITGHIPLAFNRSGRFIQFTLHNLQVRAYRDGSVPRVIYWPA